ncbi:MAG: cytochrome-c oxidase, cbb3-type subunit III [Sinobacterium sp.]|nr:cytochrome-c oxidase, cbb3-type subunit III [Sinobacterium sp.]
MDNFWSIWIIVLFVSCNATLLWLLLSNTKSDLKPNEVKSHVYDGIEEFDNPLPTWFFNLFLGSMIFGAIYLALFPGLGNFKGFLGWTSVNQWEASVEKAEGEFMTLVTPLMKKSAEELSSNPEAIKMGQRIFKNNCAVCHGVNAKGTYAFPNLTDQDWLYGGSEENIKHTIMNGRKGAMPAWKSILGQDIDPIVNYVAELSNPETDETQHPMHSKFTMLCSACHNKDGTGNHAMGAPNLRDNIWLYGSAIGEIKVTVAEGRSGIMPPFKDVLSPERIHLVMAYIMSINEATEEPAPAAH